jgi:hypothetical protein
MNNFNEIECQPLKDYNRCVLACNILEDSGRAYMENYLSQFTKQERYRISKVYSRVKKYGTKQVIKEVTQGMTFTNDDYVPIQED